MVINFLPYRVSSKNGLSITYGAVTFYYKKFLTSIKVERMK